jgi:xyloglucan:xyloglucosyl transferase
MKFFIFFVDNIPIRVFKNTRNNGGMYPTQAMKIMATIWNSTWAANGAPVNWNDAPFEAHYREFSINACQAQPTNVQECNSPRYWCNAAKFWELNLLEKQFYKNVRSKYLIYDFCTKMPLSPECQGLP